MLFSGAQGGWNQPPAGGYDYSGYYNQAGYGAGYGGGYDYSGAYGAAAGYDYSSYYGNPAWGYNGSGYGAGVWFFVTSVFYWRNCIDVVCIVRFCTNTYILINSVFNFFFNKSTKAF